MRRIALAAALSAVLCADASARVLVVSQRNGFDAQDDGSLRNAQTMRATTVSMLNRLGVDYDVVNASVGKTEFCRLGVVTYNFGTSAAFTRSYDAVIHIGANALGSLTPGYRPDSLFSSTKAPLVPQLFIGWSYSWTSGACACSLGVNTSAAGYNVMTNHIGWTKYYTGNTSLKFRSGFVDGLSLAAPYLGTVRPIIRQGTNAGNAQTVLPTVPLPCIDCDSLLQSTETDSVAIYVRQNDHIPGKKPMIVSIGNHNADDQQDPAMNLIAVALLDSLAGGTIITKPIKVAINVRGAFRRNKPNVMGGFVNEDSTVMKASIDSLASLGIPFTVGVNMDSVSTYAVEVYWWKRAALAKFTPESWSGIDSSVLVTANGKAHGGNSIDIYGRLRNRALLGPNNGSAYADGDTSLTSMLRRAFARTDSIFGIGRTDMVALPPLGDWCPRNIGTGTLDSLWYAFPRSGAKAVVVSPWEEAANPNRNRNPLGVLPQQTVMRSTLGGESTRLIATAPYPDSGSATLESGLSVDSYANSPDNSWVKHAQTFWSTVFGVRGVNRGAPNGTQEWGYDNFSRTSILTIHAGDLGAGVRADAQTRPTRPGWWYVKSVVNEAKVVNAVAGRTIVHFVPTEDIEP